MTENSDVKRGRAMTERGFAHAQANANAAHAVLHAMFEDGSVDEADALVDDGFRPTTVPASCTAISAGTRRSARSNMAMPHGRLRSMPRCCSHRPPRRRRSMPSPTARRCCGACRLMAMPCPTACGPRPMLLRSELFPRSSMPFADVHMALFAAATRNRAALDERLAVIEKRLAEGKLPAGPVVPGLFRAHERLCRRRLSRLRRASRARARRGRAHRRQPCAARTDRRHFYRRADEERRAARARAMLDARLHRRPSLRDIRWQMATAL